MISGRLCPVTCSPYGQGAQDGQYGGTDITCYSYHTQGCSGSFLRHYVHCHQASQETYQGAYCQTGNDHACSVQPCTVCRAEQEKGQTDDVHQPEYQGRDIPPAAEESVGYES